MDWFPTYDEIRAMLGKIYCSDYIGELLAKYSDTHGVSQKFFTDKALAAALEKEGVEVELRAFQE